MPAGEGRNTLTNKAVGDLRKIAKQVLGSVDSQGEYGGGSHQTSNRWYWAKVSSGSSITAGTLTSPTTFLFDIWLPSTSSPGGAFAAATESAQLGVTGYNRFNVTAAAAYTLKVHFANGEWSPMVGDCP